MEIVEVKQVTPEVGNAARRPLPQLSASAVPPSDELVERIVNSDASCSFGLAG